MKMKIHFQETFGWTIPVPSANFQSVVSPICNRQGVDLSARMENSRHSQNAILRNGRLQICATPKRGVAALVAAALLVVGPFNADALTKATPAPPAGKPVATATAPLMSPAAPATTRPAPAAADTEDIRDIRPPFHIPPGWLWLAWVGAGAALVALGYALWRWRHRLPGLRVKLPFELALDQLEAARSLMQPEHAREFSICVSEVVRNYIEVRFATRAAHRTTEEFLHDCLAEADSPLAGHRPLLGDFLHHCDLAKFARWVLSVPEMEAMLQSASAFVRETGLATPASTLSPAHSVPTSSSPRLPGVGQPDAPAFVADESDLVAASAVEKSSTLNAIPL